MSRHSTQLFLATLIALFAFSLFKNLSYPLFWNDESHAALMGKQILEYGYPKIHGRKNVVYQDIFIDGKMLNRNERTDAYVGHGWAMYYFAAAAICLAGNGRDLYAQTGRLRLPFAAAGFLGLALLSFSMAALVPKGRRALFACCFWLLSSLSISLVLHLREFRYYSLVILFGGAVLGAYAHFRFSGKLAFNRYLAIATGALFFLFNSFSPAYMSVLGSIGLYETGAFLFCWRQTSDWRRAARAFSRALAPFALSWVLLTPFFVFFRTFQVYRQTLQYWAGFEIYFKSLRYIFGFFLRSEPLLFALLLKAAAWLAYARSRGRSSETRLLLQVSVFLTSFFLGYILIISKMLIYTRYFILLLPVLSLGIVIDGWILSETVKKRRLAAAALAALFVATFRGAADVRGHVHELFHRYEGPLDVAMAYILDHYKEPDKLVIATNYEESVFMFYLDAKVLVGYYGSNLAEDLKLTPDIVMYRKAWPWVASGTVSSEIVKLYLRRARYDRVSFPVQDLPANANAELMERRGVHHHFSTVWAQNDEDRAAIYVKRGS